MKAAAGFVWWLLGTDPFWSLLGTFLGAVFGIPAGFYVNHLWSKHIERERKAQLLFAYSGRRLITIFTSSAKLKIGSAKEAIPISMSI